MKKKGNLFSFPCCVGYELFSRAVASQVFLPLQRLTSVFGMGTGGPTALKTLTIHLGLLAKPKLWFPTLSGGAPPGTRTPDPLIKSQLLYQLS